MVPTRPLIFKFTSSCTNQLRVVPSAPITIGITVTFMIHSFCSQAKCMYLSVFPLSFNFSVVYRDGKLHYLVGSLFCWLSQGLVVWPRLVDPFVSQNLREVYKSHSPGQVLGCAYGISLVKFYTCTIVSVAAFSPSHVKSYSLFTLIHLLYDRSFRIFIIRPTNVRMWHKAAFKVCLVVGPKVTRVRQGPKYIQPRWHSP